jgi:hypothetical protein
LDLGCGADLAFVGEERVGVQRVARGHTLHRLKHLRDEPRLRGQQHAQRDRL